MIKDIEDLLVWQKARLLNKMIYKISGSFPQSELHNLTSQLRRAVASICANIAEGFGRYHPQESMQFYRTARGSLSEVKSHLYLCFDQEYITKIQLDELLELITEIGKMLNGLISQTKTFRIKSQLGSSN